MEKIASFTIDHIKLKPGIYVSRKDHVGDSIITTFDLRMTSPNDEPVMNTAEVHTIEHLGATFLRNHEQWKDKTVYFGPMAAAPVSTYCWPEITPPETSSRSSPKCMNSSAISKAKFRAHPRKTAETIWT